MDQNEIVVSFTLAADEARRETVALQKNPRGMKLPIRLMSIVAVLYIVSGVTELVLDHVRVMQRASGLFHVFVGCLFAMEALLFVRSIVKVPAGETLIRFDEAGIVFERPARLTLSWAAVASVDAYDSAFILRIVPSAVTAPLQRRVVIPKRFLDDGGAAFWRLCERKLLGPLRPVSAQISVDETGALRRKDTTRLVNRLLPSAAGPWTRLWT